MSRRRAFAPIAACASLSAIAAVLAPSAATATGKTAAAAAGCSTSTLVVWLDTQANGAAGSVTYNIEFTNLSTHTCTLGGYPGVSAVSLGSRQLGTSASRDTARRPHTVSLPPGHTRSASLRIVDAGNFPASSCHPVTAAGIRVFPPNQTVAKVIPFPFAACSRSGPTYLFVRAVH
jgi:hypothetical protein